MPKIDLLEVNSVTATKTPGEYVCNVKSSINGEVVQDNFYYRPSDPYGLAPAIGQWLADNPDVVIGPVVDEPEEPAGPYSLDKMVLWLRLTEQEADQVDAAMAQQPARLRGIWNTAQSVQSDSEFFGTLQAFLTAVIGATRAGQVLAP